MCSHTRVREYTHTVGRFFSFFCGCGYRNVVVVFIDRNVKLGPVICLRLSFDLLLLQNEEVFLLEAILIASVIGNGRHAGRTAKQTNKASSLSLSNTNVVRLSCLPSNAVVFHPLSQTSRLLFFF